MEQTVKIRRNLENGMAEVIRIRESACSGDCHKCAGCGAAKETLVFRAENPIGARPGDLVIVSSRSGPVLRGAAVLYLAPMALFFLGYFLGAALWSAGAAVGGMGFLAGIGLVILYDRKVAKKENTVYTITGYTQDRILGSVKKGDNDLD